MQIIKTLSQDSREGLKESEQKMLALLQELQGLVQQSSSLAQLDQHLKVFLQEAIRPVKKVIQLHNNQYTRIRALHDQIQKSRIQSGLKTEVQKSICEEALLKVANEYVQSKTVGKKSEPRTLIDRVLQQIQNHSLCSLFVWLDSLQTDQRKDLQEFQFKVISLQFRQMLQVDQLQAVMFLRAKAKFFPDKINEFSSLMTNLVNNDCRVSEEEWHALGKSCKRILHKHLHLPTVQALQQFVGAELSLKKKIVQKQSKKGTIQTIIDQFQSPYHSIFVCPVSKEMTGPRNNPVVLPCNHVISEGALKKIVESNRPPSVRVNCPVCRVQVDSGEAKAIRY